jgi:hypothetical protein
MKLAFTNRRVIPAIDWRDESKRSAPWLAAVKLDAKTKKQLIECVFCAKKMGYSAKQILAGDYDFFQRAYPGFAECPIECWDVVDAKKKPRYQLWLSAADSGSLVEAGTTKTIANIIQCGFESKDAELCKSLAEAQAAAKKAARDVGQLRSVSFERDDDDD